MVQKALTLGSSIIYEWAENWGEGLSPPEGVKKIGRGYHFQVDGPNHREPYPF